MSTLVSRGRHKAAASRAGRRAVLRAAPPASPGPTDDQVRCLAYDLYLCRCSVGRPGVEISDGLAAERLLGRAARCDPSGEPPADQRAEFLIHEDH